MVPLEVEVDPKADKGIVALNRRLDLRSRISNMPLGEFTVGMLGILQQLFSNGYYRLPDDEVTKLEKVAEAWEKAQATKTGKR